MIELIDVCKSYPNGVRALSHIDLTIDDGEFVFVMGRNGSGKSTLLKLILKETEPTSGDIIVSDADLADMPRSYIPKYRRTLGVVFQDFRLLPDLTVYENVAFAQHVIGKSARDIKEAVPVALRMVGLSSKYKSYPRMLSGGEQQRVAIARAMVNNPKLLLADEPTGALDSKSGQQVMELFQKLNDEGVSVLMITHDAEIAAHAKRVVMIRDGEVQEKR